MWIEALLSREDLDELAQKLTPLTITLGKNEGKLSLSEPSGVTLVPDDCLRISCKATLHWPVLGLTIPVALHELSVLIFPRIEEGEEGSTLVFKLALEHADVAGIPSVIDRKITEKVNEELIAQRVQLGWGFAETLCHVFALPLALEPARRLALRVAWGQVKITAEAIALAVSFRAAVIREETT